MPFATSVFQAAANVEQQTKISKIASAATLSGYLVRDPRGEDLGCIEELMIEPASGRVIYAVLSFGGFLGFVGKLLAVPWSALNLNAEQRVFVLDATREKLENAPGFDEENWPDFGDLDWADRIHSHFGMRPYWQAA